jgi:hypothetical protein
VFLRFSLTIVFVALAASRAEAQLAIPPLNVPTEAPSPAPTHAKPKPRPPSAPKLDAVLDRPLRLNGAEGLMTIEKRGDSIVVSKLTLAGESLVNSAQKCEIRIEGERSIPVAALGSVDGLTRYEAALPACPLRFDLLDGSVLVPTQQAACVFQAAECQASPSGLWGPDRVALAKHVEAISTARKRAEKELAENFKRLSGLYKGKPESKELSAEEEAFAGRRDEICHDYEGEAELGYCASRITYARAANLAARARDAKRTP